MSRRVSGMQFFAIAVMLVTLAANVVRAEETLKVSNEPLHDGRINPMLFGNFIELLDDVVPSMWAEMLNDRDFEGVVPPANWVYYDGSPTFCDRTWDKSEDWTATSDDAPFTGQKCAKIVAVGERAAKLSQAGLEVKQGEIYEVSGWLRCEGKVRVQAVLMARLPDGTLSELVAGDTWQPTAEYTRFSAKLP